MINTHMIKKKLPEVKRKNPPKLIEYREFKKLQNFKRCIWGKYRCVLAPSFTSSPMSLFGYCQKLAGLDGPFFFLILW